MESISELCTLSIIATAATAATLAMNAFDYVESFSETDDDNDDLYESDDSDEILSKMEPSGNMSHVESADVTDLESTTPNSASSSFPATQEDGIEIEDKKLAKFSRKRGCGEIKSPGTDSEAKRVRDKSKTLHQEEMELLDCTNY